LYAYLLKQNLGADIDAGSFLEGNGAFSFYLIQVKLNDDQGDLKAKAMVIG
jgi:insulysin